MAESIIAPSLSLRDKFDLLNSAKEIIPLGEAKTFSGKRYTQAEALTKLRSQDMSDLINPATENSKYVYYDKPELMISNRTYFEFSGPWSYAAIFINFYSKITSRYGYGIVYNGSTASYSQNDLDKDKLVQSPYQYIYIDL